MAHLRDALIAPPKAPVVTPTGEIKYVQYGAGINGMVKVGDRGRIYLERWAEDDGFKLLSQCYSDDEKPLLREYERYIDEVRSGKVAPGSFPAELLPKEVRERRARAEITPDKRPAFKPIVEVDEKKAKGK